MTYQLVATCLFGLEKFLGEEIDALGCRRIDTMDGRVTFEGSETDIARANIFLRFAERVYIKLGSFPATSFTELFDGTKALPWEELIGKTDEFPVNGHAIKSVLFSVPDCQSIIKKAIAVRLGEKYGVSTLAECSGIKYKVEFFIFKDVATLMIDTSGVTLHKRGYRPDAGAAPLRETLAAALVYNARIREDILLWDPFCGSGTIPIEAAMAVNKIAPGAKRGFTAEHFPQLGAKCWRDAREEAESVKLDTKFEAYGSDNDATCLEIAEENARRAGVDKYIKFFRCDARDIKKPEGRRGTLICNPPYGERMLEMADAERLYRSIGKNFASFTPWQIYVLTANDTFEKHYGSRADRVRKLYNGMIPCNLYQFYKPKNR